MINIMQSDSEMDSEMVEITMDYQKEALDIFKHAAEQEKQWAEYLFKDGSIIGLNKDILCSYVDYIAAKRMSDSGFYYDGPKLSNPLPWMSSWLDSDSVQVAPQESEISSYLVGAINSEVSDNEFRDFEI